MFQTIPLVDTMGSEQGWLIVPSGRGVRELEKGFTGGELDEDSTRIKASAIKVNLSEEEAIELVDKIRDELPINR